MKLWTCASLAVGLCSASASAQFRAWTIQFGTGQDDAANALVADGAGGFFAGGFEKSARIGPNVRQENAWVARYDSSGNRRWLSQLSRDRVRAIARDAEGGVFVAGGTRAPGNGLSDAWVARVDGEGTQHWITQFGTPLFVDRAMALCPDGAGGAFVAGDTQGALVGPSAGGQDPWLARYGAAGNRLWIVQFGTVGSDNTYALASDGAGGAYVAGASSGNIAGGPAGIAGDNWIARYNADGNRVWARQFGTPWADEVRALAPDGVGGVFLLGHTAGALVGPGTGSSDAWLGRYDASGERLWLQQFGSTGDEFATALTVDPAGGLFVTGTTFGDLAGQNAGDTDVWLAHCNAAGDRNWVVQFGTAAADAAQGLAQDSAGAAVGGFTSGSLLGQNSGGQDVWLARFLRCYADCNVDGVLNLADFGCFRTRYYLENAYADCNSDGALNLADFTCFQTWFAAGCP